MRLRMDGQGMDETKDVIGDESLDGGLTEDARQDSVEDATSRRSEEGTAQKTRSGMGGGIANCRGSDRGC